MYLQIIADTVLSLLPWNCRIYGYKKIGVDFAKKLSPIVRRGNNFAWCDSSWWQVRRISQALRLFGDVDKFAKFLKSLPNIHQISPNVFFFRQTFSIHLANTLQWQLCLLSFSLHLQLISTTMLFKQAYGFLLSSSWPLILPQFCVNKVTVSYGIFTLTNPLCHCHVTNLFYHPLTPIRSMLSQYSFSVFTVWIPCYHSALPYHVPT